MYGMFYIQIIHGLALGLYSTYYLCSIIFYNVLQLGLLKLSEVIDLVVKPWSQLFELGVDYQDLILNQTILVENLRIIYESEKIPHLEYFHIVNPDFWRTVSLKTLIVQVLCRKNNICRQMIISKMDSSKGRTQEKNCLVKRIEVLLS